MPPIIDKNRCITCGICVNICPQDVFFGSKRKKVPKVTYPEECWHCNACVLDCPKEGAIRLRIPTPMFICHQ
jgi:adenylylsulfate reductase subunit B